MLSIFNKEEKILQEKKGLLKEEASFSELKKEFAEMVVEYENLLEQTAFITRVSDRLQKKLDKTNLQLADTNEKLRETIEQLMKAKISRKARTIILVSALVLFLLIEGLAEPYIDVIAQNFYLSLSIKAAVALSLKPLESVLENAMVKKERMKVNNV